MRAASFNARVGIERWFVMKRFFLVTVTALALVPSLASAQGWTFVYRPELRGMIAVPTQQVAAEPKAVVDKVPPTPAEIVARHEAMARGYRARANDRSGANVVAAAHCDRLIAQAQAELRRTR
jgi:hypothetical protein